MLIVLFIVLLGVGVKLLGIYFLGEMFEEAFTG